MAGDGGRAADLRAPLVLLPGELLPLHIFEERYKRMIGRCLDEGEPFGIVFRDDEGGARRIGCEARVTEVTERFDDGRLNIVVTGERPFRVLDRFEAAEYPAGEVEPVDPPPRTPTSEAAARRRRAREAFAELVRRVGGEPPEPAELEAYDSYGIAARVELPAETKQRLLELRSEPERMRMLAAALGALVDAVARSREIAERAKVNGKRDHRRPLSAGSGDGDRAAAARVAAAAQLAGRRIAGDRVDAAEEDVSIAASGRPRSRAPRAARAPPRRPRARPGPRPASKWTRGASTASSTVAARRTTSADDRLQDRRADPVRAAAAEPGLELAVAQDHGRRHHRGHPAARPAWRWKPSGFRSSSPSMLLTWTPVPGTISPEPVPFEQVTLAQRPSPSSAVMWVVEPSRSRRRPARSRAAKPVARRGPARNSSRALRLRRLHRRDQVAPGPPARRPLEQLEREGDQDPARGRAAGW